MTLRKFAFMVFTTIGVGMLVGILHSVTKIFTNIGLFYGIQVGGFVSTTALMGFWAYLTLNFLVRGLIPPRLWQWIQLVVAAIVFVDMIYLRYIREGQTGSIWPYVGYASWPLTISLIISYIKAKVSGKNAFIPAVFFLYVFTIVEWYVALKFDEPGLTTAVGTILLACNSYLILLLGRLLRD